MGYLAFVSFLLHFTRTAFVFFLFFRPCPVAFPSLSRLRPVSVSVPSSSVANTDASDGVAPRPLSPLSHSSCQPRQPWSHLHFNDALPWGEGAPLRPPGSQQGAPDRRSPHLLVAVWGGRQRATHSTETMSANCLKSSRLFTADVGSVLTKTDAANIVGNNGAVALLFCLPRSTTSYQRAGWNRSHIPF